MRDCPRKKYADERKKRETPRLGDSLANDSAKKESANRHEQQKPIIERKEDSISPDPRVKSIQSQPTEKSQPNSQISKFVLLLPPFAWQYDMSNELASIRLITIDFML